MPKYNHSFEEIDGTVYEHWTNRDGNEHTYIGIGSTDDDDDDDYDDGEEGCGACGNPAYPYCKDSCPLFDD